MGASESADPDLNELFWHRLELPSCLRNWWPPGVGRQEFGKQIVERQAKAAC